MAVEEKMDEATAKQLVDLLTQATRAMNESVKVAEQRCSPQFAEKLKQVIAQSMADIGWDVLEAIYHQHPQLRPYELKQQGG